MWRLVDFFSIRSIGQRFRLSWYLSCFRSHGGILVTIKFRIGKMPSFQDAETYTVRFFVLFFRRR